MTRIIIDDEGLKRAAYAAQAADPKLPRAARRQAARDGKLDWSKLAQRSTPHPDGNRARRRGALPAFAPLVKPTAPEDEAATQGTTPGTVQD